LYINYQIKKMEFVFIYLFIYIRSFTYVKLDMSIKKYNYNSLQFMYYNTTHYLLASIQHNMITEQYKIKPFCEWNLLPQICVFV